MAARDFTNIESPRITGLMAFGCIPENPMQSTYGASDILLGTGV